MGEQHLKLEGQELDKFVLEQWRKLEAEQVRKAEDEREEKRRKEAAEIRSHEIEIERMRLEAMKSNKKEEGIGGETHKNKNYHLLKSLQKYDRCTDLDEYIDNFEHVAQQNGVPKEEWLAELQVRVTGDLQSFLLTEDVRKKYHEYDTVKSLLLTHAGYSAERYRGKWNDLKPQSDNFREFHSQLVRSLDNWVASTGTDKSYEGLRDLMCRNKLLINMNPEIVKTVLLNKPTSCESVLTQIDTIKSTGQDTVAQK